jgi:malate dehydrogenase (oxaloacetate-decarboxylating)(NADP+)
MDPRLLTAVSVAVAKAAIESGVARKNITGWDEYAIRLNELMGYDNKLIRRFTEMARQNPKRVVFAEGSHENMLKAAVTARSEGICHPVLLGNDERIQKLADELQLDLDGIEIVNLRHDREEERRNRYAAILCKKRAREGATYDEAKDKMFERNYFGMMMVETGDADAFITGVYTKYSNTIKVAKEVIGIREGYSHFGAMHIMTGKKGTFFLADTLINRHPSAETLIDVVRLTHHAVSFFAHNPVMAMLSYSNFGADTKGSPVRVHDVIRYMHENYPDIVIDGEMQANFALDKKMRDAKYPFSKLNGKDVNTLIFPNLNSANIAQKLMQEMGGAEMIGPIQTGLNKPIHFTDIESSVRDIVNITTVAVIDAIVQEQIKK